MMATFRTRSFLQDDGPLALGVQGLTCTLPPMIGIMIRFGHRLAVDARRGGDLSHYADAVSWIVSAVTIVFDAEDRPSAQKPVPVLRGGV